MEKHFKLSNPSAMRQKYHYVLNTWSIFMAFEQQKGPGQICYLKTKNHTPPI